MSQYRIASSKKVEMPVSGRVAPACAGKMVPRAHAASSSTGNIVPRVLDGHRNQLIGTISIETGQVGASMSVQRAQWAGPDGWAGPCRGKPPGLDDGQRPCRGVICSATAPPCSALRSRTSPCRGRLLRVTDGQRPCRGSRLVWHGSVRIPPELPSQPCPKGVRRVPPPVG